MNRKIVTFASALTLAWTAAAVAAPGQSGGGQPAEKHSMKQESMKQESMKHEPMMNESMKQQSMERSEKEVRSRQEEAQGQATRTEEETRSRAMTEGAAAAGSKGDEMQARQQERKEIQDQYRTAVKEGDAEKTKGKKPWWKFWGSDEETE